MPFLWNYNLLYLTENLQVVCIASEWFHKSIKITPVNRLMCYNVAGGVKILLFWNVGKPLVHKTENGLKMNERIFKFILLQS